MKILAIETSADETGVAILEIKETVTILTNVVLSQASKHSEFGGIFPNLAKREHSQNIVPLFEQALKEANLLLPCHPELDSGSSGHTPGSRVKPGMTEELRTILSHEPDLFEKFIKLIPSIEKPDIDYISVTKGPGLEPALWVGINFAKALALVWNIPIIPVNHMEGHIVSTLLPEKLKTSNFELRTLSFPALALLISGGHTELVLVEEIGKYKILGATFDDAVGEAFDKVARLLGLPYPGGPEIARLAEQASHTSPQPSPSLGEGVKISLPRPMLHSNDLNFSFSGLKTAVRRLVEELGSKMQDLKPEISKEFQEAVTEVLVSKTKKALFQTGAKSLVVAGGVSANKNLQKEFKNLAEELAIDIYFPPVELTGDNALMIALAGYFNILGKKITLDETISAQGNLKL